MRESDRKGMYVRNIGKERWGEREIGRGRERGRER